MKLIYAAIVALFILASCNKAVDVNWNKNAKLPAASGFTDFLILKGAHYATNNILKSLNKQEMSFEAKFDSTCMYATIQPENNLDINKLYGFTDGGYDPHINSARFGWRWNGKAIDIFAYTYSASQRSSLLLGTVSIGETTLMKISLQPGYYTFDFKGRTESLRRTTTGDSIKGYQLYPYFGGDETAPHDVHIFIKE